MATKSTSSVKKSVRPAKSVSKPKVAAAKKPEAKKESGLSVSMFDAEGKAKGNVTLPASLFGAKVNPTLMAQSVRVFLANQREGGARTKTRGEVEGSSRKIYKQKGTGRARHGSIRAPIFVGGGIVFGPVTRDYHLKLTKGMKRGALVSALSAKSNDVMVVDGLESMEPKTKHMAKLMHTLGATDSVLLVVSSDTERLIRAARNIENLDVLDAKSLYPYAIVTHKKIVFTKKALEESKAHFV